VNSQPEAHQSDATIVLPCAGAAQRLQIPHPKELFPVGPGRVLIDATFDLISPILERVNVVVVLRPPKLGLVHYLERYAKRARLAFVCQPASSGEFVEAIRAALPWCSARVVVLLPDELVEPRPTHLDPVGALISSLDEHPVAFLTVSEKDPSRLASDGALKLDEDGRVVDYLDKAGWAFPGLNAIWTGLAFRRQAANDLLDALAATPGQRLPQTMLERSGISGAPTIPVASVRPVGTWPQIQALILSQHCPGVGNRHREQETPCKPPFTR
jgi:NDP-sugar pyrophosphorylase family protein